MIATACSPSPTFPPPGPIRPAPSPPFKVLPDGGLPEGEVTRGEQSNLFGTRGYRLFGPGGFDAGTSPPLVVALHGCTQTADSFAELTGLDALAQERGFAVVYPEQNVAANATRCWNWFVTANQTRASGEASLLADLTDAITEQLQVDRSRIYVTGLSAGAAMALNLGVTYPDVFAAVAAHSGCPYAGFPCTEQGNPDPVVLGDLAYAAMGTFKRPVPLLVFQGDADEVVPPVNATRVVTQWARTIARATDGGMDAVADLTESGLVPDGHAYQHDTFLGPGTIERYEVSGMGHAYSGGKPGAPYSDPAGPDATRISYEFFLAHPK
ncbi:MAG: extracellular catalytic domain type 1 short-chain-length polyhydroxyalkanoate depolymerase [Myxococcaceae bacterium]